MSRHYGPMASEHKHIMGMLPKEARPRRAGSIFIVALIVLILVAGSGLAWYWTVWRDGWLGASGPGLAAAGWVGSMNGYDDIMFDRYMLPSARKTGAMADMFDLVSIRELHKERRMVFGNIQAGEPEYLPESDLDRVRSGMVGFGGADGISVAARVDVSAEMSWSDGRWAGDSRPVSFHIVCVERHGKWYVYTGAPLDDGDASDISIDEEVPAEVDTTVDPVPTPFVRERRPVKPSDTAGNELFSGLVEIEGNQVTLPCGLDALQPLFSITEEGLAMEIAPNGMMDHLPLKMADDSYAAAWIYAGVANNGTEPAIVSDGVLCRLWIGLPLDGFSAYPEVYLPGDVTLGSSYDEVVSVYGELEACPDTDRVEKWSEDAKVYAAPFGKSVHNRIYFQFADDVLSAIGWDYYDFNSYAGDLA